MTKVIIIQAQFNCAVNIVHGGFIAVQFIECKRPPVIDMALIFIYGKRTVKTCNSILLLLFYAVYNTFVIAGAECIIIALFTFLEIRKGRQHAPGSQDH